MSHSLFNSQPFVNAFWVFVGIVAGAMIQHFLNHLSFRKAARNALKVLKVETEMNIEELHRFLAHVSRLKERVACGQAGIDDLSFPMANFDYSALAPLVNSGYFHSMLGPELSRAYFAFFRFFNNQSADRLSEKLRAEHERGASIAFLQEIELRSKELATAYSHLLRAELPLLGQEFSVRIRK